MPKVCSDNRSTTVWLNDLPVCLDRLRITLSTAGGILRIVYWILDMYTLYIMYTYMSIDFIVIKPELQKPSKTWGHDQPIRP